MPGIQTEQETQIQLLNIYAKDFDQVVGFDFTETFNPIVKPTTIQVMLTIALSRGWLIHQLYINNVFLNGVLHEKFYGTTSQIYSAQPISYCFQIT